MSTPAPAKQLTFCLWETAIERKPEGSVTLRAQTPLSSVSAKHAARILGVREWTARDLYRAPG